MSAISHLVLYGSIASCDDKTIRDILAGHSLDEHIVQRSMRPRHLRLLASMRRAKLADFGRVARCPFMNPECAVDFCSSGKKARALIELSDDATYFQLYSQPEFKDGRVPIGDDREGAEYFRTSDVVFDVLSARIRYAGDVLLDHLVDWYNSCGLLNRYMHDKKVDDAYKMATCYEVYQRQKFDSVEEGGVVETSPYEFMVAYARYTKYFPVAMRLHRFAAKQKQADAHVADMKAKGCTSEQLDFVARGQEAAEQASPVERKKAKRIARMMATNTSTSELWNAVERICKEGVAELVMSFL